MDIFVIYFIIIIITFVINLQVTYIAVRATLVSCEGFLNELLVGIGHAMLVCYMLVLCGCACDLLVMKCDGQR